MPLTKCPDCGKEISTLAENCPNCGRPMNSFKIPVQFNRKYSFPFCPVCAAEISTTFAQKGWKTVNGERITIYRCKYCNEMVEPFYPQYNISHYMEKAREKYGNENKHEDIVLEEIKQNPLFDEARYNRSAKMISKGNDEHQKKVLDEIFDKECTKNSPKCPTCGSTNIEKISTLSKAAGAYMFGLISKTARSQFKCKNCGYKW